MKGVYNDDTAMYEGASVINGAMLVSEGVNDLRYTRFTLTDRFSLHLTNLVEEDSDIYRLIRLLNLNS